MVSAIKKLMKIIDVQVRQLISECKADIATLSVNGTMIKKNNKTTN